MHWNTCLDTSSGMPIETFTMSYFRIVFKPTSCSIWRQSQSIHVYVYEDRICTYVAYCVTCCNKCQSLCKHFVVAVHSTKQHCHVQSISATYTDDCLSGPGVFRNPIFKTIHEFSHTGDVCGIYAFLQILLFISYKQRGMERYRFFRPVELMDKVGYFFIVSHGMITFSGPGFFLFPHDKN